MKELEQVAWGWASKTYAATVYKTYGVNLRWVLDQFQKQEGKCVGCGVSFAHPTQKALTLGVRCEIDHCHKTGKVRGLLCRRCNDFLGKVQDNKELLERLSAYLGAQGETLL